MQELLIESIQTDPDVQSRVALNEEYVNELCEEILAGRRLPPCEVFSDGEELWMADGFHRLHAYVKAGMRTLKANVHKGGRNDAAWASCASNQNHGLRRTNADKRRAVEISLRLRPEGSDQMIADHAGVCRLYVNQVRRQVSQPVNGLQVGRLGVDGRVRRLPPPPPRARPVAQAVNVAPDLSATADVGADASAAPTPAPAVESGGVGLGDAPAVADGRRLDELGKEIPDHLLALWDRGEAMREMAGAVASMGNKIRGMHESGDPLLLDENGQAIAAALESARQHLRSNIPYAVCPYCHGTLSKKCRMCRGRGIIGKFRYDTAVPAEMKLKKGP